LGHGALSSSLDEVLGMMNDPTKGERGFKTEYITKNFQNLLLMKHGTESNNC